MSCGVRHRSVSAAAATTVRRSADAAAAAATVAEATAAAEAEECQEALAAAQQARQVAEAEAHAAQLHATRLYEQLAAASSEDEHARLAVSAVSASEAAEKAKQKTTVLYEAEVGEIWRQETAEEALTGATEEARLAIDAAAAAAAEETLRLEEEAAAALQKANRPSAEEAASFRWGGQRARPRKGIVEAPRRGETYLKPPGSCKSRWADVGISVEVECCEGCALYVLDVCEQARAASHRVAQHGVASHCVADHRILGVCEHRCRLQAAATAASSSVRAWARSS